MHCESESEQQALELATIDVAAHPTLDASVPPVAISSFDFQDPYTPMSNDSACGQEV